MENKKQEELQQKLYLYQLLEQQQQMYTEKLVALEQEIADTMVTEEAVRQLEESDKEIMLSLGKDCFVKGSLEDKGRVIIDLGAGILANKKADKALKILESRRKDLEKNSDKISKRLELASQQIKKMEPELQKILGNKI